MQFFINVFGKVCLESFMLVAQYNICPAGHVSKPPTHGLGKILTVPIPMRK